MSDDINRSRPKKNTRRVVSLLASLSMLGVEFPSMKESKKIELPTRGIRGLSNAELKTSGKKRKRKRRCNK